MTPKQIRISLAEAMGWRISDCNRNSLPELTLDWVHTCEAKLIGELGADAGSLNYAYAGQLYNITVPKNCQPFRATALQRAEAILRTIEKWEDVDVCKVCGAPYNEDGCETCEERERKLNDSN